MTLIWDRENQIRLLKERIKKLTAENTRLKGDLMQMKGSRDGWKLRALNSEAKLKEAD